jgi:predicted amidohydrolase
VLGEGCVVPCVVLATFDPAKVVSARKSIPSLQHGRRFSIRDTNASPEHLQLVRGSA